MEPVYQVSQIKHLWDVLHSFLFMTLYNQLSKYILNHFSSSLLTTIIQVTIIFCLDYCTRWISLLTFLLHHHEHTYVQLSAQESKYWPDYFISHQTFFKTQILSVAYKTLHYLAPKSMTTILPVIMISSLFFSNTQIFTSGPVLTPFPLFVIVLSWFPGGSSIPSFSSLSLEMLSKIASTLTI